MQAMKAFEAAPSPRVLEENHFRTDRTTNLSEEALREILDAPVFLEDASRVGIIPVATAYEVDGDLPLDSAPHHLSQAMEKTGFFEVTTEVSTDWPSAGSVSGLRELAARYRVKMLLLYRHRFIDRERTNAWGWTYPTIVGALAAPAKTIEAAGVMEASLFDVKTGTILFTVFHRVEGSSRENLWDRPHKTRKLKEALLAEGTEILAQRVVKKLRRLDAARVAFFEKRKESLAASEPSQGVKTATGAGL
jgi:hypothetical protein